MKPKTRQEMAQELNISRTTLYRVLKREGIELPRGLLYGKEQEIIYQKFGFPGKESEKENWNKVKQDETKWRKVRQSEARWNMQNFLIFNMLPNFAFGTCDT